MRRRFGRRDCLTYAGAVATAGLAAGCARRASVEQPSPWSGVLTLSDRGMGARDVACSLAQTLPAATSILAGSAWLAVDAHTAACEIFPIVGLDRSGVRIAPPGALRAHPPGAFVEILEDLALRPSLFGLRRGDEDAQPAIQRVVEALARLGGGTVHLPRGTYPLRGTVHLPENIDLVGDGAGSILDYDGEGAAIEWAPSAIGIALNGKLAAFRLRAVRATSQVGISLRAAYVATIEHVWIDTKLGVGGFAAAGIRVTTDFAVGNTAVVNVRDCHVQSCAGDGIRVTSLPDLSNFVVNVRDSRIQSNSGWAINADGGTATRVAPSQLHIEGNDLEGNSKGGITGSFYASTITGNYWEEATGQGGAFVWIGEGEGHTLQTVQGLEIANNYVGQPTAAHGLYLAPCSGGLAVSVHNNMFASGAGTVSAVRMGGLRQSSIRDNWVTSLAPLLYGDYWESNDYNFWKCPFRFIAREVRAWREPRIVAPAELRGEDGYKMSEAGQVLAVSAYCSRPMAAGSRLRVQATIDGVVHLDTGMAAPDASDLVRRVTHVIQSRAASGSEPFAFPKGATLRASLANDGRPPPAGSDVVVEVLVGLGVPGGGFE